MAPWAPEDGIRTSRSSNGNLSAAQNCWTDNSPGWRGPSPGEGRSPLCSGAPFRHSFKVASFRSSGTGPGGPAIPKANSSRSELTASRKRAWLRMFWCTTENHHFWAIWSSCPVSVFSVPSWIRLGRLLTPGPRFETSPAEAVVRSFETAAASFCHSGLSMMIGTCR